MTEPHHDSAAFLEVVELAAEWSNAGRNGGHGAGWFVRRTCPCHHHTIVSIAFTSRAEAEHCRDVLDDDCRRTLARAG